MHARLSHNFELLAAGAARLPAVTGAALYGRGVFTVVALRGGRAFLWPQHWARLAAHAERAGVRLAALDEAAVGAELLRLVEANDVERGLARVALLARTGRGAWRAAARADDELETDLLITTTDAPAEPDAGYALTLSPYRVNTHAPLTGLKCVSYLDAVLAREEAHARDFDEAVRLNERGEVVSATTANLFWVAHGTVYTPALSTGALAGTARACVLELAAELAYPVVEGVFDLAHLGDADEIFLTSASLGVGLVTTYDFHRYSVPAGSVALRLREAYRQRALQDPDADDVRQEPTY
ncbi:MAG TPA: aminotransferase class IV [Pyrinomonadaceae bacterium]|jgi:branched-subunit amino acid aminotransferase/4-amino-4-deoxychorismate lyase